MMQLTLGKTKLVKAGASASLVLLALAGCASGTSSTQSSAAGDNGEKMEKVSLEYLHRLPDDEGMTKVSEIVKKWNDENPDIQVTATKWDGKADEMIKKLETDGKAGKTVCLAQLGYAEVPEMFTKGLLEDVSKYAPEYKGNFGGAFEQMNVGGTYVGLPQDSGPLVYMYNKAEFDALGIKAPTNLDELMAAAEKAAAAGKYILDFEGDEVQNWLSAQAAAAGSKWYSVKDDKWVVSAADEGSQVVAKMWQELLDKKLVLTEQRWQDGFKKAMLEGRLIGTIAAAWEPALFVGDLASDPNQNGKWAVTQLWDMGAGQLTGPDGGSGVAVMKGCEYPEQAMKFNNWFNTQVADLATQGLVPAALGKVETPANQKEFFGGQDIYAEFETANKNMQAVNYIPGFSAVRDPMNKAGEAALAGSGKVMDIFTAAQSASVAALQDLKLPVAE